ncbi:hypothetical protein VA599_16645 [Chromobacterium sp. TRC.1.1.SA]|uniref:ATP-binding protein n=1 Tax=Chromobacterium indicum TaxID=3110228 RepID=A0ABV0CNE5_9NEIS
MSTRNNPFALVRAADYSDSQINALWVELGEAVISSVIEPTSTISKYILGGRGSGKTHLLRYHSYPAVKLRNPNMTGIEVIKRQGYLAVFQRATALDAARFEVAVDDHGKWQQLFGVYLELKLAEGLIDALCDIKRTTPDIIFDDSSLINELTTTILDNKLFEISALEEFKKWLVVEKRKIDDAINNAAFSGGLEIRVPFSIGSLCLPIRKAIDKWSEDMRDIPLLYLIDEIENFSIKQQQVVNTLIRYGEGMATFRVTGRLYGVKTYSTIGDGEENREGAEFKKTDLDDLLKNYQKYGTFARKFVLKRIGIESQDSIIDPACYFDEIKSDNFYIDFINKLCIEEKDSIFLKPFTDAIHASKSTNLNKESIGKIITNLSLEFPLILQKLNLLIFCKKYSEKKDPIELSIAIREMCTNFINKDSTGKYYANAYSHYKADLFSQICRESKKVENIPYAGFDTFVQMSSGNARNLLIILSRAYEIAAFREVDFLKEEPLSISIQTLAATEAARFIFERDTNYGSLADQAKIAVERLATLLRTARYSLNIPEVSPLTISFSDDQLSPKSREVLDAALNYSLLFETSRGRPDRNSQRLNRKVQLNPLLSPRWGLPIGKRGDISLPAEIIASIFEPDYINEFNTALKQLNQKWNSPFNPNPALMTQVSLFD